MNDSFNGAKIILQRNQKQKTLNYCEKKIDLMN